MSCEQLRQMLIAVADKVIESKPLLTEVDSKIGDGDHGIGMERGLHKAKEKLIAMPECADVYELLREMGKTMMMEMGGASGVIFATMFMGGASGKHASASLTPAQFADVFAGGLDKIKQRGKAEVGDKTMVDALQPAVEAMQGYAGEGFEDMLALTSQAAADGMERTKGYQARFGRAKSLMERAIGFPDAGAVSVTIIFQSMNDYLRG